VSVAVEPSGGSLLESSLVPSVANEVVPSVVNEVVPSVVSQVLLGESVAAEVTPESPLSPLWSEQPPKASSVTSAVGIASRFRRMIAT
jgi:hypothetical protein